jgi:hypothetical protein
MSGLSAPTSVSVNFEVEIEGASALSIFGLPAPSVSNVLVATAKLPTTALYDAVAKKGLIEFWEPKDEPNKIKVQLANTNSSGNGGVDLTGAYQAAAKIFAKGLQRILCDSYNRLGYQSRLAICLPFFKAMYA